MQLPYRLFEDETTFSLPFLYLSWNQKHELGGKPISTMYTRSILEDGGAIRWKNTNSMDDCIQERHPVRPDPLISGLSHELKINFYLI